MIWEKKGGEKEFWGEKKCTLKQKQKKRGVFWDHRKKGVFNKRRKEV